MANSGPRTNTSQFFITYASLPHLNGRHTVFGKLVGGEDTLARIEAVKTHLNNDRPIKEIKIESIQVLSDPFEKWQEARRARIAKHDQSEEALRRRAAARAERDKDRTTWLGTDLGIKGESNGVKDERKRKVEEGGVGKYLGGTKTNGNKMGFVEEVGVEKKKRKAGGFGDFSGW
jgi:peptidyl-prolyl cis-trans isomerase-like 2